MLIGLSGKAGAGKDTVADMLVKNYGFVSVALADPLKRACQDFFQFTDDQLWGQSEKRNEPDKRYPREVLGGAIAEEDARVFAALDAAVDGRIRTEEEMKTYRTRYLTPRYALQQLGTEFGRNCYPDVWVEYALRIHARLQEGGCYYDRRAGLWPCSYADGMMVKPKKNVVIPDCRFKNELEAIKKIGGKVWRIYRPEAGLKGEAAVHRSESEQDEVPNEYFDAVLNNTSSIEELQMHLEYVMKGA